MNRLFKFLIPWTSLHRLSSLEFLGFTCPVLGLLRIDLKILGGQEVWERSTCLLSLGTWLISRFRGGFLALSRDGRRGLFALRSSGWRGAVVWRLFSPFG